ncbi:MAG: response regulator [Ardenticatenales bacterium]|nr:response regulator [Ardenticatenales bacterium]
MTRIFLADSQLHVRAALRLLLLDLNMQVVGEAADWATALDEVAASRPDMLLVDWDLIPLGSTATLADLRAACPSAVVIVLISHLDAREQAARAAGADAFIGKWETPTNMIERLHAAANSIHPL